MDRDRFVVYSGIRPDCREIKKRLQMLRDEIQEAVKMGALAMANADKVYKTIGSPAREHLLMMWRRDSHVGLVTDEAFYVVQIRAMGMFYSLDTEVRWDDASPVTWESTVVPPRQALVVASLQDQRGLHTYVFGFATDPMELTIEERRADKIVSEMNQLIARRRYPGASSSDTFNPEDFSPEAMNRLIPGAGDIPDHWYPETGPDPGDRSSGEEFAIGESQVVARTGSTIAYVVYRGSVDALPADTRQRPDIIAADRYILLYKRPDDPVEVLDDAGSFAELLTDRLTGAILSWVAPNARPYLG